MYSIVKRGHHTQYVSGSSRRQLSNLPSFLTGGIVWRGRLSRRGGSGGPLSAWQRIWIGCSPSRLPEGCWTFRMALCHEPWGPPCGQGRPRTTRSRGRVDDRAGREMKSRKGSTAFGSPVRSGPERMVRALHINLVEARTLGMAPHGLTWPWRPTYRVFLRHGSSHPVDSVLFQRLCPRRTGPRQG